MSRYDHKIETSLEGIEHLSKEKKENKERKMKKKNMKQKEWKASRTDRRTTINCGSNSKDTGDTIRKSKGNEHPQDWSRG